MQQKLILSVQDSVITQPFAQDEKSKTQDSDDFQFGKNYLLCFGLFVWIKAVKNLFLLTNCKSPYAQTCRFKIWGDKGKDDHRKR